MYRILIIISLLLSFNIAFSQSTRASSDYNIDVRIPAAWIEKIRHYDYKQNNSVLLREFERFIKPHKLVVPDFEMDLDKTKTALLNPVFTNLDDNIDGELICLLGWDKNHPSIAVFKKINADWHLLYLENFFMFYSLPELYLVNSFSKNKTFYIRRVNDSGSGIYSDSFSFYKLINNKVYKCLDLLNEAHIYGWGLYLNQSVKSTFKFNSGDADEIWVNYDYNFFPGAIKKSDCPWCSNEDVSLIKGHDGVNYVWDDKKFVYKADLPPNPSENDDLTAKKISCFSAFGNDALFVKAFKDQINKVLKIGS